MPTFAADSGLFDTIAGLPVHPLVVHVAVVVLPVSAVAFIALVLLRRARRSFGWLTMLGLFAGTAAAVVAKESGEALAKRVGTPATHASYGDLLPLIGAALAVVALLWMVLQRQRQRQQRQSARRAAGADPAEPVRDSGLVKALGAVGILAALATVGMSVLVGHSGAEAVWGNRIAATQPTPTAAAPTSTGPTSTGASAGPSSAASPASSTGSTVAAPAPTSAGRSGADSSAGGYTLAQVQQHASATSCWTVVSGGVYDLTSWISRHPGGESVIVGLCGKDGTSAFVAQHGTVGRAVNELKQFKIGVLA
ncbi:MAG: cytochrome b5 domain-containing protein [Actinomycetales bacterium]|nr:cytochrome b5 domain-containing protein [Actinomycetales bacterium]